MKAGTRVRFVGKDDVYPADQSREGTVGVVTAGIPYGNTDGTYVYYRPDTWQGLGGAITRQDQLAVEHSQKSQEAVHAKTI